MNGQSAAVTVPVYDFKLRQLFIFWNRSRWVFNQTIHGDNLESWIKWSCGQGFSWFRTLQHALFDLEEQQYERKNMSGCIFRIKLENRCLWSPCIKLTGGESGAIFAQTLMVKMDRCELYHLQVRKQRRDIRSSLSSVLSCPPKNLFLICIQTK